MDVAVDIDVDAMLKEVARSLPTAQVRSILS